MHDPVRETFTVTQVTQKIKGLLEGGLQPLWVDGEISNCIHHSSGHFYFTVKDENCQLKCVLWRWLAERMDVKPENGMQMLLFGAITVYERGGQYQLNVQLVQAAGSGVLQQAFEKLKGKLKAEGLFESEQKKPVPKFVETVGVVTSADGAAFHDIVQIIRRRAPQTQIILRSVRVQGEWAAAEICEAIQDFNAYREVDVLIVGRGGGSLEDLWPFNEESVARTMFASTIPIISAVGHEVDFTIADFVADLRAPTPSAAAELVTQDHAEKTAYTRGLIQRAYHSLRQKAEYGQERLAQFQMHYLFKNPFRMMEGIQQRLDELKHRLGTAEQHAVKIARERFTQLVRQLEAVNPLGVLNRGYSLVKKAETSEIVKRVKVLFPLEPIVVMLADGNADCTVNRILPGAEVWQKLNLRQR